MMTISEIAKKHHTWVESKNWHNKTSLESLALIASEVGEAINECRGIEPTENFGYELADIILRVLDLSVSLNIDIESKILEKIEYNLNNTKQNPNKLK